MGIWLVLAMPRRRLGMFTKALRFAEWSSACWELQKDTLLGSGTEALDLHFLGIYHEDDHSWKVTAQDTLVGRCLAQFWDVSEEAGPKARPDSLFNEQPPALDVLTITDDAVKNAGSIKVCLVS